MSTQPTPQPGEAPPLNANKISIITKSDIRYEGILYHINPQDQNITLCNVRSFGTEGRRPGDEIAPSLQITPYICFRGTDIKDLKVLESPQQGEATGTEAKPTQNQTAETIQPQVKQQTTEQVNAPQEEQKEFDFQSMKDKFEQFTSEHKSNINVKNYQQNDFFDNLSTSTAEKARDAGFDRMAQKKLDKETFGSEYVDTATHRGGRGGYRRGGRGGNYRGGNRGGHRNYGGHQGGNYGGNQGGNYGGVAIEKAAKEAMAATETKVVKEIMAVTEMKVVKEIMVVTEMKAAIVKEVTKEAKVDITKVKDTIRITNPLEETKVKKVVKEDTEIKTKVKKVAKEDMEIKTKTKDKTKDKIKIKTEIFKLTHTKTLPKSKLRERYYILI